MRARGVDVGGDVVELLDLLVGSLLETNQRGLGGDTGLAVPLPGERTRRRLLG